MKKVILVALIATINLISVQTVKAEIKLPAVVSSKMVLQRNTTVVIWGWANPDEKITISASWLNEDLTVNPDKDGNWKTEVKTTNSKLPQTIILKSKKSNIVLEDILFGEVWLCSGQSNMEQPVKGFKGQPTFGSIAAIVNSKNSNIRLFTVNKEGSEEPLKNPIKYVAWQEASPEAVANFSAVGYFFGKQLHDFLDVPIGLIHSSWGGSFIETWISKDILDSHQDILMEEGERYNRKHATLFNAMINPIIPFTIKGTIWYQGESNRHYPNEYITLFPEMVKDWRKRWGIGDFPFYYVQIAPYHYYGEDYQGAKNSAFMREAQLKCLDLIPNSGMAVTMDVGDKTCIHPPKKKEVADRLLYLALNKTYGHNAIECNGPIYESMEVVDEGIMLTFNSEASSIYGYNHLEGFEIAGEDKVFYPATAKAKNRETVLVQSEQVKNPVAVRYAWQNWIEGTFYGANMLPVSSFRTDDWDDATRAQKSTD